MVKPFDWLTQDTEVAAKAQRKLSTILTRGERNRFDYVWEYFARPSQLPPEGDWRIWMIMAGRGFGKTRAGAEWVKMIADHNPGARIALISSSLTEARAVMVEGESGLLAIYTAADRPRFEPSRRRIRFSNGAQAELFSAAEPESLRGPQHSHACGSGAKGVLHQSVSVRPGCVTFSNCHRLTGHPAGNGRGRQLLSRHGPGPSGLGWPRKCTCSANRWILAFHRPTRRNASVR